MINNRYKLEEELGRGSFSVVYKGIDTKLGHQIAIKQIEPAYNLLFSIESKVFHQVSGREGFPKLFWSGECESSLYIIMELLHSSISFLIKSDLINFSIILKVGLQTLTALETLHSLGFIHRDIKPDNILSSPDYEKFYLIDYGLCKNYIDSSTRYHAPMREDTAFKGNLVFCSKNILSGVSASRRDDIESLFLLLIYLVKKELPWINERKNLESMIGRRSSVNFNQFMKGLPIEIFDIYNYCQTLSYYQTPNYAWMKEKLKELNCKITVQVPKLRKSSQKRDVKRSKTAARRITNILECETLIAPPPDFSRKFREKIRKMRDSNK